MMAMKMDEAAQGHVRRLRLSEGDARAPARSAASATASAAASRSIVATLGPIDACVIYYGVLPGVQPDLTKLAGPVLGHYAENDGWAVARRGRARSKEQIRDAGKQRRVPHLRRRQHASQRHPPRSPRSWPKRLVTARSLLQEALA